MCITNKLNENFKDIIKHFKECFEVVHHLFELGQTLKIHVIVDNFCDTDLTQGLPTFQKVVQAKVYSTYKCPSSMIFKIKLTNKYMIISIPVFSLPYFVGSVFVQNMSILPILSARCRGKSENVSLYHGSIHY